jgi:hypothetical protein
MAGYSGTPLAQKLGIKEGHRVVLLGAPPGFAKTLEPLPPVSIGTKLKAPADVIVLFVTARAQLEDRLDAIRAAMDPAAGFWVAWPKKAAKIATDMTEQTVRDVALPTGLVDNKVCAIDETWSGLRLVIRKELRATPARAASAPPRSPRQKGRTSRGGTPAR